MQGQDNKYSLKYIDLFGVQPKFYINNKEKYRTSWGGILTFTLFSCVVIACWIYGKDMYFREQPSTTIAELPTNHPERFNVTKETFNFAFGLQGYNKQNYFDESIYQLKLFQLMVNKITAEDGTKKNEFIWRDIEPRRCTEEDFLLDREYFVTNEANFNMYCMNYDLPDVYYEGIWGSEQFSAIVGKVYPCQNSTDSDIICKSEEEIKETLNGNQYAINYSDQVLDPKNYTHPFSYVGRNSYGLASWDTYRVNNFYFQNVFLEDNVGIIFDQIEEKRGLQYSQDKELLSPGQHKDKVFLEFYLRFESAKQKKIYRTYLNLAQVMANVGGILKVLMIVLGFISVLVSKQLFNLQLANQIFAFDRGYKDEDATNNKNKNDKNQSLKKSKTFQEKQQELTRKIIIFKSYLGLLFPFCASKDTKEKKEYLNFAVEKITQRLNMNYLLEKFVEIEKIKILLLDHDQHKLFDYISKPTIDSNLIKQSKIRHEKKIKQQLSGEVNKDQEDLQSSTQIIQNVMLQENLSQEQKKKNCLNAYSKIYLKKDKTDFDYKIMNFLDDNIIKEAEKTLGLEKSNTIKENYNKLLNTSFNNQNISLCCNTTQLKVSQFNSKSQQQMSQHQVKMYPQNSRSGQRNSKLKSTQGNISSQLEIDQSNNESNVQLNSNQQELENYNQYKDFTSPMQQINEINDDLIKKPEFDLDNNNQLDQDLPLSQEFPETMDIADIQNLPQSINNSQLNTFKQSSQLQSSGYNKISSPDPSKK